MVNVGRLTGINILLICVLIGGCRGPDKPPRRQLNLRFTSSQSGKQVNAVADPEDAMPALGQISAFIVEECKPEAGATVDEPIVLGQLDVSVSVLGDRPSENRVTTVFSSAYLLQGGDVAFGWMLNSQERFRPLPQRDIEEARSVGEAALWLGKYFAMIAYECQYMANMASEARGDPNQKALPNEDELAKRWTEELRNVVDALPQATSRASGLPGQ